MILIRSSEEKARRASLSACESITRIRLSELISSIKSLLMIRYKTRRTNAEPAFPNASPPRSRSRTGVAIEPRPHLDEAAAVPAGAAVLQVGAGATGGETFLGQGPGGETRRLAAEVLGDQAFQLARAQADLNAASWAILGYSLHETRPIA